MIMRGAYGHIKHHRQAYRGTAALVERLHRIRR